MAKTAPSELVMKRCGNLLRDLRAAERRLEELKQEHGISELEDEISEGKKVLAAVMGEHKLAQIEGEGFHATLIKAVKARYWILTDDDEIPVGYKAKSLKSIIRKKHGPFSKGSISQRLWTRYVTKRVADPEGIERAVAEGLLTQKEVAAAYIEEEKQPYVRIFEDD